MEAIKNQPIMKLDFGGSFEGQYKINFNTKKEYEVQFIIDLSECLECVSANDKILEIFYKISESQKLPKIAWITIQTEYMSIRVKEDNFNKVLIYGEEKLSTVMDIRSSTPFVSIHFLTTRRPSPRA
jgi:hypothetical protein